MVQVLPRIPSLAENFVNKFTQGIDSGVNRGLNASERLAGMKVDRNQEKKQEKLAAIENGIDTIGKMRELLPHAGPSNWIPGLFGGETTKKRAELQSLGRSLIPLVAAGVPIRNQREFDEYSKVITNPNARQAELEGALNGIESVLSGATGGDSEEPSSGKKVKFSPSHPEHQAKARQLYKIHKDKAKVRELLSREFEF